MTATTTFFRALDFLFAFVAEAAAVFEHLLARVAAT
jgi:hypothetical protein